MALAEAEVVIQGFLGLLPHRRTHDGRNGARYQRPLPIPAALAIDMLALVTVLISKLRTRPARQRAAVFGP